MIERTANNKTILEPAREVDVFEEADVIVVGGGPGGVSAAISAAREGADTVLVERYGHLGGMSTGGLVLMLTEFPPGQCNEWLDRLNAVGGARVLTPIQGPRGQGVTMVDPELLKCVLNTMVDESGAKLLLHSWGTRAIADNNRVQGVVFESKSGRKAILGKVIIDATGDGDIFASAGAEFDGTVNHSLRSSQLAVVFRIANVDFDKFAEFRAANPQKWLAMRDEVDGVAGFHIGPLATSRNDVVWVNNFIEGLDAINVRDLTKVEVLIRKSMIPITEYMRGKVPGFEDCFLFDSAPQIGTRGSRRLIGKHIMTQQEIVSGVTHNDPVAIFSHGAPSGTDAKEKAANNVELSYRCLVPASMEGLLVAGRCFSSDPVANTRFNVIPPCIMMGQAAGTAAALAVKSKVNPEDVDYSKLHERLSAQGVTLPEIRSS
ncbi:FAD-dependent oxidoreductase [Chloroflexota bacterium]